MKSYLNRFKVLLIITGAVLVLFLVLLFTVGLNKNTVTYVRGNYDEPTERVYDFAGLLTDDQEQSLRDMIAEKEDLIGCDIVIVTLNQPLSSYAREFQSDLERNNGGYYNMTEDKYVQVFADNFYDNYSHGDPFYPEKAYGYNEPWGDGVILVDNWDRSDSVYNYAYNWIGTSGRCESRMSSGDIDNVLSDINDIVNEDPYGAYVRFVNDIVNIMQGNNTFAQNSVGYTIFVVIIAIVIAIIYLTKNLAANKGKVTTNKRTYVPSGKANILKQSDILLNVNVTHHTISSSSGSGGGGHHMSSGGHSHGGGGGHH